MTIRGDGSSLVNYEVSPDILRLCGPNLEPLGEVVDTLFTRLESGEVDFDTTTGNIEFPFSNGQSDLTGKITWIRMLQDWVFLRLEEMGVSDEIRQTQVLVINGLHQKARERLGIELQ